MKKISKFISAILLAALVLMPNMNALAAELENTEIVELRHQYMKSIHTKKSTTFIGESIFEEVYK